MRTDSHILLDKAKEMKQFIIDESNGLSAEELKLPKLGPPIIQDTRGSIVGVDGTTFRKGTLGIS